MSFSYGPAWNIKFFSETSQAFLVTVDGSRIFHSFSQLKQPTLKISIPRPIPLQLLKLFSAVLGAVRLALQKDELPQA